MSGQGKRSAGEQTDKMISVIEERGSLYCNDYMRGEG